MIKHKPNEMVAYVDGSYNPKTKQYGSGCVIIHHGTQIPISFSNYNPEKATMRNVAGEIDAAMRAMTEACHTKGIDKLIIVYDYDGIEKWCTGAWKTNKLWTKLYKRYYEGMKYKFDIEFHHVKGHSGDELNDYADQLAKLAVGLIESV